MTINEHDRVSTGRDDESGAPQSSHALVDRLTAGEPYAVAFGGQGSAWLENSGGAGVLGRYRGRAGDAGR